MSGGQNDSYYGGMFHSSSSGNMARRAKQHNLRKRNGSRPAVVWGVIDRRKCPPSPVRDQVAEHLSEGLDFDQIAKLMAITPKAVRRHFENIRKRLGPQAV